MNNTIKKDARWGAGALRILALLLAVTYAQADSRTVIVNDDNELRPRNLKVSGSLGTSGPGRIDATTADTADYAVVSGSSSQSGTSGAVTTGSFTMTVGGSNSVVIGAVTFVLPKRLTELSGTLPTNQLYVASQALSESGTSNNTVMTPQRTAQAIAVQALPVLYTGVEDADRVGADAKLGDFYKAVGRSEIVTITFSGVPADFDYFDVANPISTATGRYVGFFSGGGSGQDVDIDTSGLSTPEAVAAAVAAALTSSGDFGAVAADGAIVTITYSIGDVTYVPGTDFSGSEAAFMVGTEGLAVGNVWALTDADPSIDASWTKLTPLDISSSLVIGDPDGSHITLKGADGGTDAVNVYNASAVRRFVIDWNEGFGRSVFFCTGATGNGGLFIKGNGDIGIGPDTNSYDGGSGSSGQALFVEPSTKKVRVKPTYALTGNVTFTSSAATSGTVTFNAICREETLYMSSGSTIASLSVALPTTTVAGQIVRVMTKSDITSLTLTGTVAAGASLTTLAAGGCAAYQATNTTGTFIRIK